MIDLKKPVDQTALMKSELNELTETNRQLQGELDVVRGKLNNELDVLTYKLEKVAYETEEIRREVRDINRTIDKLRYDLLDAVRNKKSSEVSDVISHLLTIFMTAAPGVIFVIVVLIIALMG